MEDRKSTGETSRMAAVIVAAGASNRMKGTNKLFAPLGDKPLLAWSVETCHECSLIRRIILVLNHDDLGRGHELEETRRWSKVRYVPGDPGDRIQCGRDLSR